MCVSYLHVLRSKPEDNHALKAAQRTKIVSAFVLRLLLRVVGKNLKTSKLSPMADNAITQGGIGSLVSLCISVT